LGNTINGRFETLHENFAFLVSLEGKIDGSGGIVDEFLKSLCLISSLVGLSLFENVDGSSSDMILESEILVSEEVIHGVSLDLTVASVDIPVFKLSFSDSQEISEFILNVLMVECFHGEDLISRCSSVESNEQREEDMVLTLNVEIHDLEPENPWDVGRFHDPVKIDSSHTEVQYEETSPECYYKDQQK